MQAMREGGFESVSHGVPRVCPESNDRTLDHRVQLRKSRNLPAFSVPQLWTNKSQNVRGWHKFRPATHRARHSRASGSPVLDARLRGGDIAPWVAALRRCDLCVKLFVFPHLSKECMNNLG